jgi:hypothetical protein
MVERKRKKMRNDFIEEQGREELRKDFLFFSLLSSLFSFLYLWARPLPIWFYRSKIPGDRLVTIGIEIECRGEER